MLDETIDSEDFERKIKDPFLIETRDEAIRIINALDQIITGIQSQIDVFNIKHQDMQLTPDEDGWLNRASYACNIKRQQRHRVMQRDKEFRNVKIQQNDALKIVKKTEKIAREERLKIEAETRRAAKYVEVLKLQTLQSEISERKNFAKIFVRTAREKLSPEIFEEIECAARKKKELLDAGQ